MKLKQVNPGAPHKQDRIYDVGGVAPALASSNFGHDVKIMVKNATKQGGITIQNGGGDEHNIPDKPNQAWACD